MVHNIFEVTKLHEILELFTRNKSNSKPVIKQIIELIPGGYLCQFRY